MLRGKAVRERNRLVHARRHHDRAQVIQRLGDGRLAIENRRLPRQFVRDRLREPRAGRDEITRPRIMFRLGDQVRRDELRTSRIVGDHHDFRGPKVPVDPDGPGQGPLGKLHVRVPRPTILSTAGIVRVPNASAAIAAAPPGTEHEFEIKLVTRGEHQVRPPVLARRRTDGDLFHPRHLRGTARWISDDGYDAFPPGNQAGRIEWRNRRPRSTPGRCKVSGALGSTCVWYSRTCAIARLRAAVRSAGTRRGRPHLLFRDANLVLGEVRIVKPPAESTERVVPAMSHVLEDRGNRGDGRGGVPFGQRDFRRIELERPEKLFDAIAVGRGGIIQDGNHGARQIKGFPTRGEAGGLTLGGLAAR